MRSLSLRAFRTDERHLCLALLMITLVAPCVARAQVAASTNVPAQIIGAFDAMFAGPRAGQRAVHAKGLLCEGIFSPASGSSLLSRAEHFAGNDVSVLVRFTNFAAVPGMPDGHPAASPHGMSVKFLLPEGESTDIVTHSYNGFPASIPEDFLAFLRAVPNPTAMEKFAASHPAARAFLDTPKPAPASYGTEAYFGVNAFLFSNAAGTTVAGRYRFVPLAGIAYLSPGEAAAKAPGFLSEAMTDQLLRGPVAFRLEVQLAGEGDVVDDGAVAWPANRPTVELGTIKLHAVVPVADERQNGLTFIPTNIVGGISLSNDPMLLARTQAYRISAERRFHAP